MNDHGVEIARALSGAFANQWADFQKNFIREIFSEHHELKKLDESDREKVIRRIEEWYSDPRKFFITNFSAETSFEEELYEDPLLILNEQFLRKWNAIRNIEVARTLKIKNDPLSNYAILFKEEKKELPTEKEILAYYFGYFERMGPERSGQLEEVIGPMGSGKSNFLAWKAIRALQRGIIVFTNFALKNVPQSFHKNWHEIHSYTDLFEQTIQLKKQGYNDIVFWIIDEQGRAPGGSSQTMTMREGRWTSEILTMIRKFGVFLTRARQSENIPADQLEWVSFIIEKNIHEPEKVDVQRLHKGEMEERFSFTIPNMKEYYDTNDPCLIYMDLNMEMLQKYASRKQQKGEDPIEAMESFVLLAKKLDEAQWKEFERNIEKMEEKIDHLAKEDRRGKNPNSLKNLLPFRNKDPNVTEK